MLTAGNVTTCLCGMGRVSGVMVTGGGVTFAILSVLMSPFILCRNVSVVETKLSAMVMILVLSVKLCPCRSFRRLVVSRMKSFVAEILLFSLTLGNFPTGSPSAKRPWRAKRATRVANMF